MEKSKTEKDEITIYDETDIKKINGNYFCYKHISYRDLLNNGQKLKKDRVVLQNILKNVKDWTL